MGIWIRSQDKNRLLNLNGYNIYFEKNGLWKILGFDTSSDNNDMYWTLGEYSTKWKALKVLDMIQERIIEIDQNNYFGLAHQTCEKNIFQMPQDGEVIIDG